MTYNPLHVQIRTRTRKFAYPLTYGIILLCLILFLVNSAQTAWLAKHEGELAAVTVLTPLEKQMFFDYPKAMQMLEAFFVRYHPNSIEELKALPAEARREFKQARRFPQWQGIYDAIVSKRARHTDKQASMFGKILHGQVWRLVTPILLHENWLQILFDMLWVWYLGRMIEGRLSRLRMVGLMLIIAAVSDVAQYLMTGPYFLGYSGVAVGMAGFVWMRQRIAPWEGYPLPGIVMAFLAFFIGAILLLEVVDFFLQLSHVLKQGVMIANTAHIVGGLCGIGLARLPYFARKPS